MTPGAAVHVVPCVLGDDAGDDQVNSTTGIRLPKNPPSPTSLTCDCR